MNHLKDPITEYTFTDLLNWDGEKKKLDDEEWLNFLQDIFFIGTEEGEGLIQVYCLPDLEV